MKQSALKKLLIGLLIGAACGLLVWAFSETIFKEFFFKIEAQTYDWRTRLNTGPQKSVIQDIVIVDVDERSVNKLGSYHQWPRTYWATLITNLSNAGVKLIGTDFIFDADRRHPEDDQALKLAIFDSKKLCSALYFSQADSERYQYVMTEEPEGLDFAPFIKTVPVDLFEKLLRQDRLEPEETGFLNASKTAGYVNLFPDPDGILRRIPLFLRFNDHVYASFAVQMAMTMMDVREINYDNDKNVVSLALEDNSSVEIPLQKHGQMLIHYEGGFQSFRYISFYDVLMGFVPEEFFRDRIILIGSSLPGLYDLRSTPIQQAFPGVEVNANVLYQMLNQKFIYTLPAFPNFLLILLVGIFVGLLLVYLRPIASVSLTIILIMLTILADVFALQLYSYWLPLIPPVLTIILVFTANYLYRYMFEEKDKRKIRKTFSHYVSPSVVDVVLKNPDKLKLGGERKHCSVLFSDVAGFTTISERLSPEDLVSLLNEYLTHMTDIVFENNGMLDKYEGDAIMAVFGAPIELPDHARLACLTALQMQKKLVWLREKWTREGQPALLARIGVNSGEMVAGNMGSQTRFDYTVMGDAVNLASRLEGANKVYDTSIMVGENTQNLIKDEFITRPLDLLRVKGKKKPIRAFEVIALKSEDLGPEFEEMLAHYQKGFENYLLRNWEWAMNHFRQALQIKGDDGPSRLYLLRCQEFVENPPGDDWDGVYVMKTK